METLFIRNKNKIKTISTGETEVFKSINLAKKKSRELQLANGGLGRGAVVACK